MSESQFITYAQNGEDVLLWRALKHVQKGFYIDVGAQDPVVDSVTKAFYDHGWHGINIEPVLHWYERLVEQRPRDINLCVAASDHDGELKLYESDNSGLSTSNERFAQTASERGWELHENSVPCTMLSKICTQNVTGPVHFLKVDCEGAEAAALRGMPLSQTRPWIILVEASEPNSSVPTHAQWESLLTGNGYEFVYADGINRYYVAEERHELRAVFGMPPNALDDYIHASELRARELQREVAELQSELRGQALEVARLQQEYRDVSGERESARVELASARVELAHVQRDRQQLQRELVGHAAEISRLQGEYREITEAREVMHAELVRLQHDYSTVSGAHEAASTQLASMLASHSWRLTAPLRTMRRACARAERVVGRQLLTGLRPVAHVLRPVLRRLSRSASVRKVVVGALGRNASIVRHGRLFLYGKPPQVRSPPSEGIDRSAAPAASTWSRRERMAMSELRRALGSSHDGGAA